MKKEFVLKVIVLCFTAFIIYIYGIDPMLKFSFARDYKTNNSWTNGKLSMSQDIYDVIVVGEEPEGIASAVTAARMGARTLIIAEDATLGGCLLKDMNYNLEINRNDGEKDLNKGYVYELNDIMESKFSEASYLKAVNGMVNSEKKLDVIYKATKLKPLLEGNTITGITAVIEGTERTYTGKRVIDATFDGKLLKLCGVPFFYGSEDLNITNSYLPVKLNFIIEGPNFKDTREMAKNKNAELKKAASLYKSTNAKINAKDLNFIYQGQNNILVQGLEIHDVDVMNQDNVDKAYVNASKEVQLIFDYLQRSISELHNYKLLKIAERFKIRESIHFKGEHVLNINEVLENTNFKDKIALGSFPVIADKFGSNSSYIIGSPKEFSVPLGCLVPNKVDNLIMVGNKISYSSIISSSTSTLGLNLTIAQSAGIFAAYTVAKDIKPREMLNKNNEGRVKELSKILKKNSIYLPEFSHDNPNASNWSYPSVRKLNNLALVAAGRSNNYKFSKQAVSQDMAILLLNGVYRLSPQKYSLDLDMRLRKFFNNNKLTKYKLAEMLSSLYMINSNKPKTYLELCDEGYINIEMQDRLKDKDVLNMDDVYYLSVYNIERFTGVRIAD